MGNYSCLAIQENKLIVSKGCMTFLYTFFLDIDKFYDNRNKKIDIEGLNQKLLDSKIAKCKFKNRKYIDEFKVVDRKFLNPKNPYYNKEDVLYLGEYNLYATISSKIPVIIKLLEPIKAELLLRFCPTLKEATLYICINLDNYNIDEIIFLKKCLIKKICNLDKYENICKYINSINGLFTKIQTEKSNEITSSCLIEIKQIGNKNVNYFDFDTLLRKYQKQIYGMLVADGGWQFVPAKTAFSRLDKKWSTRNYFLTIGIDSSVVVFNFIHGYEYNNYTLNKESNYTITPHEHKYKSYEADQKFNIAGLQHGILLNLQIASFNKLYLDTLFTKKNSSKGIRKLVSAISSFVTGIINYKYLNETLQKEASLKEAYTYLNDLNSIGELNELYSIIKSNMAIETSMIQLEKELTFIENKSMIQYQKRINLLMMLIAIIGVAVGYPTLIELLKLILQHIHILYATTTTCEHLII